MWVGSMGGTVSMSTEAESARAFPLRLPFLRLATILNSPGCDAATNRPASLMAPPDASQVAVSPTGWPRASLKTAWKSHGVPRQQVRPARLKNEDFRLIQRRLGCARAIPRIDRRIGAGENQERQRCYHEATSSEFR